MFLVSANNNFNIKSKSLHLNNTIVYILIFVAERMREHPKPTRLKGNAVEETSTKTTF